MINGERRDEIKKRVLEIFRMVEKKGKIKEYDDEEMNLFLSFMECELASLRYRFFN